MRRAVYLILCLCLGFGFAPPCLGKDLVRVGGYPFPPFVENGPNGYQGLTLDMLSLLNKTQDRVEFQFVPTSARRRYADLQEGKFDAIFFEEPEWGWTAKAMPVEFSRIFLSGGELYISQRQPGRDESYFQDLKNRRLVAMLGYHYGFANYEDDPEVIKRSFNIQLVNDNRSCIEMVLAGRVDVAVVTDAYLWRYLSQTPDAQNKLLISERKDQTYSHRILLKQNLAKLDIATVNQWLDQLERDGHLAALWKKAGISRQ